MFCEIYNPQIILDLSEAKQWNTVLIDKKKWYFQIRITIEIHIVAEM